jgi:hypothetical protein
MGRLNQQFDKQNERANEILCVCNCTEPHSVFGFCMQSSTQNYRKSKRWNTKFLRQMSSSKKVEEYLHKWALYKAVINPLTLNCKYKKK